MIRVRIPWLGVLALVVLCTGDAAAQLEFAGIPWGTPAAQAAERIRAAGYTFRGVDQDGDHVFGAADSVDVVAMFDSAGLVYVEWKWVRDPDRLPARYARLADSLRAALGRPDEEPSDGESERWMTWNRDSASLELFLFPRSGGADSALFLRHRSSGYEAEFERRVAADQERNEWERSEGTRDTTAVGDYHQAFGDFAVLIRVDTVKYERLGPQTYRARVVHDWMQTRRLPNGLMYNGALTEVELDCRAFRTRLLRTIPLYGFRATPPIDVPEAERRWTTPTPRSSDGRAIRSACEALGRQP